MAAETPKTVERLHEGVSEEAMKIPETEVVRTLSDEQIAHIGRELVRHKKSWCHD